MPFIVFEGIDGCGKSTQIKHLAATLDAQDIPYVLTREPGGTPLAEEIRRLLIQTTGEAPVPKAELLLYGASRAQHIAKVIQPALEEKKWVISDRFVASTFAFQSAGRKLKVKDVVFINNFVTDRLNPDLTILLDVPVAESQRRMGLRGTQQGIGRDRFEQEKLDFYHRVRKSYLLQAQRNSKRWLVVDGTQEPEQIAAQIQKVLRGKKWLR